MAKGRKVIDGVTYYYKLKDDGKEDSSLYGAYKYDTEALRRGIIVCRHVPELKNWVGVGESVYTGETLLMYTLFPSHLDLYHHMMTIPVEKRSFFEVILGTKLQKPHFDIDIAIDEYTSMEAVKDMVDDIIDAIIDTVKNNDVDLDLDKDVLIYDSSRSDKASYHVVINNWVHRDNVDAKNLYKQVVYGGYDEDITDSIDHAVYSSTQQFRLLHCSKVMTSNIKVAVKERITSKYTIRYPTVTNATDEFAWSMVGVPLGCQVLPSFYDPDKPIIIESNGRISNDVPYLGPSETDVALTDKEVKECMEALSNIIDTRSLSVKNVTRSRIDLGNNGGYSCPICHRVHDNENPYLMTNNSGSVFFHCRRTSEKPMLITKVDRAAPVIETEIEDEDAEIDLEAAKMDMLKCVGLGVTRREGSVDILKTLSFQSISRK